MKREKKLVLGGVCAAILVVAVAAIVAPSDDELDYRPSTYNASPGGAKAAYMLLAKLGYRVTRSDKPLTELSRFDAMHTTFIMANPWSNSSKEEWNALGEFIKRGGHVLGEGQSGMVALPGVYWEDEDAKDESCRTTPEGTSPLAAVGPLQMRTFVVAKGDLVETEVAQRCKDGAAVIQYPYGAGHVVWWADVAPLTNKGLHDDANLKLFLASIGGKDRTIVFDESNNDFAPSHGFWDEAGGLPLKALAWQLVLALIFLVLSYGRRHGPLRTLMTTPRTSPLEFAYSMGNLYHRAKAGEAAASEARLRLLRVMEGQCGLSRDILEAGPEMIADELSHRLNYRSADLIELLQKSAEGKRMPPAEALSAVKRMNQIAEELRAAVSRAQTLPYQEKTLV